VQLNQRSGSPKNKKLEKEFVMAAHAAIPSGGVNRYG
jgi:hypothetical protein